MSIEALNFDLTQQRRSRGVRWAAAQAQPARPSTTSCSFSGGRCAKRL